MQNKTPSVFWRKGILWLLAISLLCTILSRIADSFTVAKVTVCSPAARKIQHTLTAEGKIEKNREISVITQPDLLVQSIQVNEGEKVKKGDTLAILDPDHIEESLTGIREERNALELQNEATRNNQNQERKKQQQLIQRAKADYEWLKKQNQKQLQQTETALKKTQKELEKTKNAKKHATPSNQPSKPRKADTDGASTDAGYDTSLSLQESLNNQKKELAELQKSSRTEELAAKRALEDAKAALPSDHSIEINNLSIQKYNRQMEQLLALQKQNGKVLAPADGVITAILVNIGQKTPDTGIFTMTDEKAGLKFVGQISPKDANLVSTGDNISIKKGDQETEVPIISLVKEETEEFLNLTALLPSDTFSLGDTVSASVVQESETYPCTVPLTAVYEENGKKYILFLDTENTVLGEQEVARKAEVQVVEQNESYAALESETITADCQIITDTDRLVKAGDRIRLTES